MKRISPRGSGGVMNKYMTRRSWLGAAAMFAVSGVAIAQEDFTKLPPNLTVPLDDGACDHLLHMQVPAILLNATVGGTVSLPAVKAERTIVYCYPRTGEPGKPGPDGWIPFPVREGALRKAAPCAIITTPFAVWVGMCLE